MREPRRLGTQHFERAEGIGGIEAQGVLRYLRTQSSFHLFSQCNGAVWVENIPIFTAGHRSPGSFKFCLAAFMLICLAALGKSKYLFLKEDAFGIWSFVFNLFQFFCVVVICY